MRIGEWDSDSGEVFCIAECGINHNGSIDTAEKLIDAAKDAGADAVKFQWFSTDALVKRRGPGAAFLRQYELGACYLAGLKRYAEMRGLVFLCSVFDEASAEAYLALDPAAVKIGSGELRELALLRLVAKAGKPVILSTGMATLEDVSQAVLALHGREYVLLHCVSAYPTPLEQVNLRAMDRLKEWAFPVGFSDHTQGFWAAEIAVARGACIIEKHLTLDHRAPGPDHKASMEPREFGYMVQRIRGVGVLLGDGKKRVMECEAATLKACGR